MAEWTEQRLAYGFGLLGAGLIALGGLVTLVTGAADLALGHPLGALGAVSAAIVLLVVGGLAGFFAWIGRHDWSDRPLASGILLIVIAVLGWAVVGIDASLLALIGSLFVFLAGILFVLAPARRAASTGASA